MQRLVTPLIAGLTLVVGFVLAQGTGNRLLGGAVLLGGGIWCVAREARRTAAWRLVVVAVVAVTSFAASHPAADVIGAWPAVLLAAVVTAVATWLLVPSRGHVGGSGPAELAGRGSTSR